MVHKFTVAKFRILSCLICFISLFLLFPQNSFSQSGWNLQYSSSGGGFGAIDFLNSNTGLCVGWSGKIVKTTNAGLNWNQLSVFTNSNDFHCIKILDSNNIIIGGISKIYKSSNFGVSWDSLNYGVYFFDIAANDSRILVCGDNKLIYSIDMGYSWEIQTFTPLNWGMMRLKGICFADDNNFWMVSFESWGYPRQYAGRVFHSTDAGLSWFVTLTMNGEEIFQDIFFINSSSGFISGRSHFFQTTNSGINWNDISANLNLINATRIDFVGAETGYVVGTDSNFPPGDAVITYTTNHGLDWCSQLTVGGSSTSEFRGIHFMNGATGWVCGYHDGVGGVIFKTTNGGISGISNKNEVPVSFSLSQNIPNPFNSSTFITYTLPSTSNVMLKIYNITGKQIATLVNKIQPAGEYKISLSADNFASGIYFYRLEAGDYVKVKKMILLK